MQPGETLLPLVMLSSSHLSLSAVLISLCHSGISQA